MTNHEAANKLTDSLAGDPGRADDRLSKGGEIVRKVLITAAALLFVTAIALGGIEVLGIEVLGPSERGIEVLCIPVLPGSYVEAIMVQDGIEVLADSQPVGLTGHVSLFMPAITPGSHLDLRDPGGHLIDRVLLQP